MIMPIYFIRAFVMLYVTATDNSVLYDVTSQRLFDLMAGALAIDRGGSLRSLA